MDIMKKMVIFCLIFVKFSVEATERPNIVFILADDLGWADVGYAETTDVQTPNIDRIAGRSLHLPHSYTHSVCTPSRAALFTGIYPFRYGLQGRAIPLMVPYGLDENVRIFPEELKRLGYSTHLVGKWHLGFCKNSYTPLKRGFDSFLGYLSGHMTYYSHERFDQGANIYDFWDNGQLLENTDYSMHSFANRSVGIIKDAKEPFLLFVSSQAVHAPLEPPPGYHEAANKRDIFKAIVTELDDLVGRVEQTLKDRGLLRNTVFIFTSDNGGQPLYSGSNFPLRGAKHTFWEGGTRARTFIHHPSLRAGNYDGLFHAVDWFPTILSMAGGSSSGDLDGVDQWPALQNPNLQPPRTSFIYHLDKKSDRTNAGIRLRERTASGTHDYKLILGSPGRANDWYTIGQTDIPTSKLRFDQGALFDMTLPDARLEREELPGHAMVREKMKSILEKEISKCFHDPPRLDKVSTTVLPKTRDGIYVAAPGWC